MDGPQLSQKPAQPAGPQLSLVPEGHAVPCQGPKPARPPAQVLPLQSDRSRRCLLAAAPPEEPQLPGPEDAGNGRGPLRRAGQRLPGSRRMAEAEGSRHGHGRLRRPRGRSQARACRSSEAVRYGDTAGGRPWRPPQLGHQLSTSANGRSQPGHMEPARKAQAALPLSDPRRGSPQATAGTLRDQQARRDHVVVLPLPHQGRAGPQGRSRAGKAGVGQVPPLGPPQRRAPASHASEDVLRRLALARCTVCACPQAECAQAPPGARAPAARGRPQPGAGASARSGPGAASAETWWARWQCLRGPTPAGPPGRPPQWPQPPSWAAARAAAKSTSGGWLRARACVASASARALPAQSPADSNGGSGARRWAGTHRARATRPPPSATAAAQRSWRVEKGSDLRTAIA